MAEEQTVACEACGLDYKWKTSLAGKQVRCKCGHVFRFPQEMGGQDDVFEIEPEQEAVATEEEDQAPEYDLGDLQAAASEAAVATPTAAPVRTIRVCPACSAPVALDAVLCTCCGYDFATGKRLNTSVVAGRMGTGPGRLAHGRLGGSIRQWTLGRKMIVAGSTVGSGLVVLVVLALAAPEAGAMVGAAIVIAGAACALMGLVWAWFVATQDSVLLMIACRFIPILGLIMLVIKCLTDWGSMKRPMAWLFGGGVLAAVGGGIFVWMTALAARMGH